MKIEIRYLSKTGNTEKIAKAIGSELGIEPKTIKESVKEDTDLLFLGGAYYGFMIDEELKKFISNLENVKKVALFTTSAIMKGVHKEMRKRLKAKGIEVLEEHFYSKGEYKFTNKGRPNEEDLNAAKKFARKVVGE